MIAGHNPQYLYQAFFIGHFVRNSLLRGHETCNTCSVERRLGGGQVRGGTFGDRPERSLWNSLLKRHHYLGFHSLIGQSLRYVAVYEDRWLALLGWGAAALKCKVRDQWIGWTPALKLQRLPLVVNNSRFLILPDVSVPNLASRVLSLNLKLLSHD